MQDLTPVGLSQDGTRLLLVGPEGEEFAVSVDPRLRAALRGENARLGRLEMKMESALRPRDIQARIRAGESPEEVAAAAQTTVEAIMGFATPVLAERAHVAHNALKASVRRRSGESSSAGRTLDEAAVVFFAEHRLHEEDVEWDAWRRPDGRWALVAVYAPGGRSRSAEFTYDLPGRYVLAENDEARILTGELREPEPVTRQPAEAGPASSRRLTSVPFQDELPLGDDAIELVREREPAADEPTEPIEPSVPDQPTEPDRSDPTGGPAQEPTQTPTPAPFTDPGADTADADWMTRTPAGAGRVEDEDEDAQPEHVERAAAGTSSVDHDSSPTSPAPKKKIRSSVPSWDEIMFGGGKND